MEMMYDAVYVDLIRNTAFVYGAAVAVLFTQLWFVIDGFLSRRFRWWPL